MGVAMAAHHADPRRAGHGRAVEMAGSEGESAPGRPGQHDLVDAERRHLEPRHRRSEEHTSELQSLMRISYAVFCLKKKKNNESMKRTTSTKPKNTHQNTITRMH